MTTTSLDPGFAVAAVDGTEEGYTAVAYAASEAARHGLELRVVHVMPACLPVGPLLMSADDQGMAAHAAEALASARRVALDVEPELRVTSHVFAGGRVSHLVQAARGARFVVVGRRPGTALDRAWSGGTLDGVVSRAGCPVVVVPSTEHRDDHPVRVVAAFKDSAHADELFDAAYRAADELGVELEILHAWKLAGDYDDIIARRVSEAATNRTQKDAIRALLPPWREGYPHVMVRISVVHQYPVRALVEASRDACRLILVKPRHGVALHHLGRTARGALRFAQCPIEVVPAKVHDALTLAPIRLEREGELVP